MGISPRLWCLQRETGQPSGITWLVWACVFIRQILNGPACGQGAGGGQNTDTLSTWSFWSSSKYKGMGITKCHDREISGHCEREQSVDGFRRKQPDLSKTWQEGQRSWGGVGEEGIRSPATEGFEGVRIYDESNGKVLRRDVS